MPAVTPTFTANERIGQLYARSAAGEGELRRSLAGRLQTKLVEERRGHQTSPSLKHGSQVRLEDLRREAELWRRCDPPQRRPVLRRQYRQQPNPIW